MGIRGFLWRVTSGKAAVITAAALGLAFVSCAALARYAEAAGREISDGVIRFHVIAESDGYEDQALKLKVRDGILACLEPKLAEANDIDATRAVLLAELSLIEETARDIVAAEGYDYAVKAELTAGVFPTRRYGGAALPSGTYETLRVTIGSGGGRNWWCVMFPKLCFSAEEPTVTEQSKTLMYGAMSDEAFNVVFNDGGGVNYKAKFKIIELWQKIRGTGK